ncbi:hypothetical protein M2133_002873, partial [Parabacteroides sp. PF5-6]|nr:hypothetical protein [Parabacteroides sp. PF5-6]
YKNGALKARKQIFRAFSAPLCVGVFPTQGCADLTAY